MARRFSIAERAGSFRHAFAGLLFMLRTQHNARIHLGAAATVAIAGFALGITREDWRWLIAAIALVSMAEAVNTAFEHLCDVVSPDFHASVKLSKDIAAGAVLIAAIAAAIIGATVFWPYVLGR